MNNRSKNRFLEEAEEISSIIREELQKETSARPQRPTHEQLLVALRKIDTMRRNIEEKPSPRTRIPYRTLTRILVDEWPFGDSLAKQLNELEDLYIQVWKVSVKSEKTQ